MSIDHFDDVAFWLAAAGTDITDWHHHLELTCGSGQVMVARGTAQLHGTDPATGFIVARVCELNADRTALGGCAFESGGIGAVFGPVDGLYAIWDIAHTPTVDAGYWSCPIADIASADSWFVAFGGVYLEARSPDAVLAPMSVSLFARSWCLH